MHAHTQTHTCAHARTHARTHARAHTHTHTHAQSYIFTIYGRFVRLGAGIFDHTNFLDSPLGVVFDESNKNNNVYDRIFAISIQQRQQKYNKRPEHTNPYGSYRKYYHVSTKIWNHPNPPESTRIHPNPPESTPNQPKPTETSADNNLEKVLTHS